ncbi:MAG: class III extradiol dioxygenase subunit B-like domain-containing protein [Syntrophaceticus schinkii]
MCRCIATPPIIIPEIGGDELQKAKSTVTAMREWAAFMTEQRPEVLVFISPHGVFTRRQMGYLQTQDLFGDFAAFGAMEISFQVKNDLDLERKIAEEASREGVEVLGVDLDNWYVNDLGSLDHGITVPLYYLEEAGLDASLVAFGISLLPLPKLYKFGQAQEGIGEFPSTRRDHRQR